jgi:hypothetical protein
LGRSATGKIAVGVVIPMIETWRLVLIILLVVAMSIKCDNNDEDKVVRVVNYDLHSTKK